MPFTFDFPSKYWATNNYVLNFVFVFVVVAIVSLLEEWGERLFLHWPIFSCCSFICNFYGCICKHCTVAAPIVIMANEFLFLGWQWGDGQSQTNSSLLPSRKRRRNITESESGFLCFASPPSNQLFNSSSTHILFVVVGFLLPFQLKIFLSMKICWRQRKVGTKGVGYFWKEVNPKVAWCFFFRSIT